MKTRTSIIASLSIIMLSCILASLVCAWIIYPDSGLETQFDKQGVEFFFSYFKIPLNIFIATLTGTTILFSLYRILISQKALEIQSRSFLHSAFNDRVTSLRDFIRKTTEEQTSFTEDNINSAKIFSFLFPDSWKKSDFFDETGGIKNIEDLRNSINYFEQLEVETSFPEPEYMIHVQNCCDTLGVQASIQDFYSALTTENELIFLLNNISKSWMFIGRELIKPPYYITSRL